jgi:hypothetical protein
MNEIDNFYSHAAEDIIKASASHAPFVFRRACIDFVASVAALSTPPDDISKIMDELYESYLYFIKAASSHHTLPDPNLNVPDL